MHPSPKLSEHLEQVPSESKPYPNEHLSQKFWASFSEHMMHPLSLELHDLQDLSSEDKYMLPLLHLSHFNILFFKSSSEW